jgi:hypothetical protein
VQGLKTWLRPLKWSFLNWSAQLRARIPIGSLSQGTTFLLGCGRSGTTALGHVLGGHRQLIYFNEPIHYWNAIDPRTDFLNFFGNQGRGFLDATDATDEAKKRFRRLFGQARAFAGKSRVLEKYPPDGLRMGWLAELDPGAKFIHIIRDGRDVCRSINAIAETNRYRVAGMPDLHQWWGRGYHKWMTFARECRERGIMPEAFDVIDQPGPDHFNAMAALEWIVRIRTIRDSASRLGLGPDRYAEVRYEELTTAPGPILRQLEELIGIDHDPDMARAGERELAARGHPASSLALPEPCFTEFVGQLGSLGYDADRVTRV